MKMRLLDRQEVKKKKLVIQAVNLLLPVLIVAAAGAIFTFVRKRKYTRAL
jgi:hypothetical protein